MKNNNNANDSTKHANKKDPNIGATKTDYNSRTDSNRYQSDDETDRNSNANTETNQYHRRTKRSNSIEYYVEVMIAVDISMQRIHGNKLESYIINLMSIVSRIYKHHTVGNYIDMILTKIVLLDEATSKRIISSNAVSTLKKFCAFQQEHSTHNGMIDHFDTAVLITKHDTNK
ncbi:hypothetical protein HELRODRAFT_163211 [Helobdella robusta]|uniref:Uncharacterized protein n=1 Tax=Helobdella robusta TaxID=6412 RepID=T1ETT1_HELRO|nr:hypothetical protein HELRODRAFT_163211 [Helobdella robusta]ESN96177.1 hypothetical protein HELRODRAFT_163211 [Helobdella robusta]